MISQKLQIKWNFELNVFKLSVPDLYDLSFGFLEIDSILLDLQADHIPCSCSKLSRKL